MRSLPSPPQQEALDVAVGQNVKRRRQELGLTQQQLAVEADLALPTVSRIERGVNLPDLTTLERLAEAMNTTVVALVGVTQPEPEEATA